MTSEEPEGRRLVHALEHPAGYGAGHGLGGRLRGTIGATLDAWEGAGGSQRWDAEGKVLVSTTELVVHALVVVA